MWRVFGLLFFGDKERFYDRRNKRIDKDGIERMLTELKIGVGETATEVIRTRDNASDKYLEIVRPVDLAGLLAKVPDCGILATTGEKAAGVIAGLTGTSVPKMGESATCSVRMADGRNRDFLHWRLPSTSRAFPMTLEKKASFYGEMLQSAGIFKG